MQKPIFIIGQGISGTMLSWYLHQANIPFLVMDNDAPNTASKVAAGIINPVTGRRIVTTWMIDEIMPFAVQAYQQFGAQFKIDVITQKNIVDLFPTKQMQDAFMVRVNEKAPYLMGETLQDFSKEFNFNYGYGVINPCYVVDVKKILLYWRNYLMQNNLIRIENFFEDDVSIIENKISYKNMEVEKIIFANGANCEKNKWFKNLPFAPNKGEALIIEAPSLPQDYIYKKGITIAPIENQQFWVGANYCWKYENDNPTEIFYKETKQVLESMLKMKFKIMEHKAAIRPANIERRPFVGFHPIQKNIGIFNGMGAKGTSLAPFFANQFVQHIQFNIPILLEADVARFTKVLSR